MVLGAVKIIDVTTSWDPDQYLKFEAERARAFHDLVAQVADRSPARVVDLGCGPGQLTATLARRWPAARVTGVDSNLDMLDAARPWAEKAEYAGRLEFVHGGIEDWRPPVPVDLIISNAALHWVPSHVDLLPVWVREALAPGGALAFQVPAASGSAARAAIRSVASAPRWSGRLGDGSGSQRGVRRAEPEPPSATIVRGPVSERGPVLAPEEYLDLLARAGCRVNAWETTYQHVLPGGDAVLEWFSGSGLRPYLDALASDPEALAEFRGEVAAALREAFPPRPYGTVLPFRRIFVVAEVDQ